MADTNTRHSGKIPDQGALRAVGKRVRERLADNPAAYKLPTDRAEIWAVGAFYSPAECERLRDMIDGVARPSSVYEGAEDDDYRTSSSGDVDRDDPFVRKISRRIDDFLGLDSGWGEAIQGQRYLPGQQFKPHHDWFHQDSSYWDREMARGGQRCITAMAFLNDVEEGGTTDFTEVGLSVTPQTGALLVWNNADADGVPNLDTMHAGTPVIRGVKYIFTRWYRTRDWN
ncbi:prolyl hydroxylase family protein [Paraurantiacibacter namhicola]|uniref:Fe2OG dioxygenase domain-containing protein n=1 Tax=Paraurantiacibacter namhicola TaxID=645517 RepID=A0A1C7D9Z7_9SPHN|nr:2OG-Fe(II) oxygenase [Paraurantiacibacter namhicola]ANU08316.1 hypothetical protein A6F65_02029 [Paraurantiacibacter namhicola]